MGTIRWMDSDIRELLRDCLPNLASQIEAETGKPITDFKNDLYPRLVAIDQQIPGIGMQFVIWDNSTPWFPFDLQFDGIIRGLSYVPYLLASVPHVVASRWVTQGFGAHIEHCIELFCRIKGLKFCKPLGHCVGSQRSAIGEPLASNILKFLSLSWNKAKHKYHTGTPDSVIPIQNSLACYFIARHLGASILEGCKQLDVVVKSVQDSYGEGRVYNRPPL